MALVEKPRSRAREILEALRASLMRALSSHPLPPETVTVLVSDEMSDGFWRPAWAAGKPVPETFEIVRIAHIARPSLRGALVEADNVESRKLAAALATPAPRRVVVVAGGGVLVEQIGRTMPKERVACGSFADDLAFAMHKQPHVLRCMEANIAAIAHVPFVERVGAPAVLVVGAGPTLDLDRVKAAHDAGASIWTVNTVARAVCRVVAPDVVVAAESLDVSDHFDDLEHSPRMLVAGIGAHPNVFRRAHAFYVPMSRGPIARMSAALHVPPIDAGSSSLTTAIALAAAGGAKWIGLEGVDLAYSRDGAGYAPGARYQARLAKVAGEMGQIEGGVAQRELAERSGQRAPATNIAVRRVQARDGGKPLRAQLPWVSQIQWLEDFAARHRGSIALDRGTGLAALVGWGRYTTPPTGAFRATTRRLA